jgi:hypothetical protein
LRESDYWECEQSYNSFYAPPAAQQAVAINTYLALLGSSIAGLSASAMFTGFTGAGLKLNIFDAQRSSVAGMACLTQSCARVSTHLQMPSDPVLQSFFDISPVV